MKKILYVFDDINYRGGAQKAMLFQIKVLQEFYQIDVFSLSYPKPGIVPENAALIGEKISKKTELLVKGFKEVIVSQEFSIRKKLVRVCYAILTRLGKIEGYLEKLMGRELVPEMECYDAVVVASESSKLRSIVSKLEKPKKIQWIHTDYKLWSSFSEWTQCITSRDGEIYQKFDYIVALSEHNRKGLLEKLPGMQEKVVVIQNLIDGEKVIEGAKEGTAVGMDPSKANFITVGRLDREKGHDNIIDLCIKLKKEKYPFCWYLVGDGPLKKHIEERVAKEGLEGCVVMTGHLDNPYPLMKQCDRLVMLSEYEGTPVTIDEAMVLGVPVVSKGVGGIGEQLGRADGNSVLEPGQDFEEIKKVLLKEKRVAQKLDYKAVNSLAASKLKMLLGSKKQSEIRFKVSVIVPVYNTEKYLEQCLESLVKQTLDSIQIIVVNDGSIDSSQKIINRYVKKYPDRMLGLTKENGGPGEARNFALRYAEGEYIGFADADDWADERLYEVLYQSAKSQKAEAVICDLYMVNEEGDNRVLSRGYRGDALDAGKREFIQYALDPAFVWNKLFYHQLFEIKKFPSIWYEDMAVTPVLLSYAEKIGYVPVPLYYYRQRENSITHQEEDERNLDVILAWKVFIEEANGYYREEIVFSVYKSIIAFFHWRKEFQKKYIDFLMEEKNIFLNNHYIVTGIKEKSIENLFENSI